MTQGVGAGELWQRARSGMLANLGLKLVAMVIAVILYALVHRVPQENPESPPAVPLCAPCTEPVSTCSAPE